jgi:NAD-dependent SIR2 family protein deacetylase
MHGDIAGRMINVQKAGPENSDIQAASRLAIDAFVRSIIVNKGRPICLLLGAGASLSSGMPSAERCIWEWKRDIFVTNNPSLRESVGELSLQGTRARIQAWLNLRGNYPPVGSDAEYSFYAEECYPTVADRRSFFHGFVQTAIPHIGYRLIPLLVKSDLIKSVWTTNFDGLAARACAASNVVAVEIGIDCAHRALRPHVQGELRVVSLHGDYRYDALKNTKTELQEQEVEFKRALLNELQGCDLVVMGYSGRDKSLMSALEESFVAQGCTRIYWCGFGETPPEEVAKLINMAHTCGRDAFYVGTEGFDDVMARVAMRHLDGALLQEAKAMLEAAGKSQPSGKLFAVPPLEPTALFKSNAYPLAYPGEVLRARLTFPENTNRREWLDTKLAGLDACGVVAEDGAFLLGDANDLMNALAGNVVGSIAALAVSGEDFAKDRRLKSLLQRGFVRAARRFLDVKTGGYRLWEPKSYAVKPHGNARYSIHRAVKVHFLMLSGQPLAVLMPEVMVMDMTGELAGPDVAKVLRNEIYGYQHNKEFDADLQHWTKQLVDIDIKAWAGSIYRLSKAPWYAGLHEKGKRSLPPSFQRHARQAGLIVQDTPLVFCSKSGTSEVRNIHPLQGLVNNRPWDFGLTQTGLSSQVDLAVLCPAQDTEQLKRFLPRLHERANPGDKEQDYLLPYPGFSSAFGLPLCIPAHGDADWISLNDKLEGSTLAAAKMLGQRICRGLDAIRNAKPGAIAVIYVPTRWKDLKIVKTESEHFNLHDYVKAYAARAGLSTQFVREETTQNVQACRVRWWISLALYSKALRTPWRLDCVDDETAYVGIGYSIDQEATIGNHVLLGCSHLYSSRGEGLQFRLGRIENPIIRGRHPFMSEDDARRTGETIRQLFFDAKMRLPSRVVVHKRTRFSEEEQRGLCQGLEGISNVELIEINVEESLRYLASKQVNGKLEVDGFPVPRGTTVVLGGHAALLWVHGSAPNVQNPKFRYYQGKRRIPAPLLIRRYLGQSDVVQVASEILGLSKMNWNHFDYYSQMPATLGSASAIAKVGTYLSAFGSAPYDYRLLI